MIDDYKIDQLSDGLYIFPGMVNNSELQLSELDWGVQTHAPTNEPANKLQIHSTATLTKNGEIEFQGSNKEISVLEETEFLDEVRGVAYWGHESGGKDVRIEGSLTPNTDWDQQSLTITILPFEKEQNCPYKLTVTCYTSGAVELSLDIYPFGVGTGLTIHDGPVETINPEQIHRSLTEQKPFGTSRINELVETCGVTKKRARVEYLYEIGYTHKQISNIFGISEGASRSYVSKTNKATKESLKRIICMTNPRKRILSHATFPNETSKTVRWRYLCQEVKSEQLWLVTVEKQRTTGSGSKSLEMESESFNRIGEIDREYNLLECPIDEAVAWEELLNRIDTGYIHEDCINPLVEALQRR